jgi:ATP-binding cassette subfamily B protein
MPSTRSYLTSKLKLATGVLPHLPRALGLVRTAAGTWMWIWLLLLLIQGLLPVATVFLSRELVDSLVAVAGSGGGWAVLKRPLLFALIMAGLLITGELLRSLVQWVRTVQSELVSDHVRSLIHERAAAVDIAFYESSDYFDKLHRARNDAMYRPAALIDNLGNLLQSSLTLVAMAGVLITFGWWLPLLLVLSTAPALLVVVDYAVRQHQWRLRVTTDERRSRYFDYLITSREAVQELRLFNLGGHFRELFKTLRNRLRGEQIDLAAREAKAQLGAGITALIMMMGAIVWMLAKAVRGLITLGELTMFYQAFTQGQRLLRALLETVGQIYSNSLFLGNLFEFLELEPVITDPGQPAPTVIVSCPAISFRNLSFAYPGSQRQVLDDFSLEVQGGTLVALLGRNGAGKSTLFKLLCRFYDPDAGSIEIDGTDIRHLELSELRWRISVLFQEPMHFDATVRRNIAYGDLQAEDDSIRIEAAARAAGIGDAVARLPCGLDSNLGRWFGGAELSVGEWQRIALARCFVRNSDIVLLDEPTSSMDSWAESDWLDRFIGLVTGHTAIIISHRLTTAMRADVIHIVEEGRIVESGSHQELLLLRGRYFDTWQRHVDH